jgi:NAD(P)-dependent dehydrogenase (short-subunit alcohol dehydrogenase family)
MPPQDLLLSLEGKVAIVTGSGKTRGIGAATAIALAHHGASVVINHVSDSSASSASEIAARISDQGGKAKVVQADISTPAGAQKLVDEAVAAFGGKIDILGLSN